MMASGHIPPFPRARNVRPGFALASLGFLASGHGGYRTMSGCKPSSGHPDRRGRTQVSSPIQGKGAEAGTWFWGEPYALQKRGHLGDVRAFGPLANQQRGCQ
jgi:hypothetical protein